MADSDLSPQERQMISDGITIAGNAAGVALAFAGIPGAGPLITAVGDLLFQGFAPAKNPAEAYYLALSRQIAEMEATLLNKLLEINHQIQNLQTSLTNLVNEIGLQIDLTTYNQAQNVINQYYNDLVDFTKATTIPETAKESAKNLYKLFDDHSDEVAIQLQNLHDTLLPGQDGVPGLLNRQLQVIERSVLHWAQDKRNVETTKLTRLPPVTGYNYPRILSDAYKTAGNQAIDAYIVPIFARVLTLQYRGLTFLIIAWGGGDRTDQIQLHVDNAKEIFKKITDLISDMADPARVDSVIYSTLQNPFNGCRRILLLSR
jgi:hypothetical protein